MSQSILKSLPTSQIKYDPYTKELILADKQRFQLTPDHTLALDWDDEILHASIFSPDTVQIEGTTPGYLVGWITAHQKVTISTPGVGVIHQSFEAGEIMCLLTNKSSIPTYTSGVIGANPLLCMYRIPLQGPLGVLQEDGVILTKNGLMVINTVWQTRPEKSRNIVFSQN